MSLGANLAVVAYISAYNIDSRPYYVTFNERWIKRNEAVMIPSTGKFVAYYRVSTGRQGKSGLGIDAQRAAVETCLNGGDWTIVDEHVEVESGKRSDRPALDKALAAARLHRASLVVSKVDRLTRSVAFLSRLLEAGVDVRFADLPQIEGATGRFLLQQMVAVAELEAGMISKRTKDALAQARKRGAQLGGRRRKIIGEDAKGKPIFGAVANGSPEGRAAAKRARSERAAQRAVDIGPTIRALQAAGATTLQAVADGLNAQGIPTARGTGSWSPTQIMRILARL
jgi:DNA invertase Pin-like site-specific DNA recombinase